MTASRPIRWAALVAVPLVLGACQYEGASDLPLPGAVGADEGYRVEVILPDAVNLVEKESCRANDTVVGSVESVELTDELQARVVCRVRHEVDLPANIIATVRQTSLLGERFVSLDVPVGTEPAGTLAADTVIPASRTRVDPDTELVLGALSQVLNGSGLASIETITRELNVALEESDPRGTLRSLRRFAGELNANRATLTRTLDSLDRFSATLAGQRGVIGEALDAVPAGLAVLDRQRPALVRTLQQLSALSDTAVPLIRKVRADTVAGFEDLVPVLTELTTAGENVAKSIERVVSFPFPSNALSVIKGDYGGMYGTISLDLDALNQQLEHAPAAPVPTTAAPEPLPALTGLPGLLGLGQLPVVPDVRGVDILLDDLLGGSR